MRIPLASFALFCTVLSGCGQTEFFAPLPTTSQLRLGIAAETVMVNEATVPEYALNQEIPVQQPGGALLADTGRLWADLPGRALQGALTRHLSAITGARVAAAPWPLSGFPDAEVSTFVDDMIVQADGTLRFTGSYAVRSELGRDRTGVFTIIVPVANVESYVAIMAAHEAAWQRLAEQIARAL